MTIDQALLREKIERMDDVKTLLRLEPHGDRFRYQIETPFRTWPAFVIGTLRSPSRSPRCSAHWPTLHPNSRAARIDARSARRCLRRPSKEAQPPKS